MKDKTKRAAAETGIASVKHVIAMDIVLPIARPVKPVTKLRIEPLQGIFTGKSTNGKEADSKDERIVVISRNSSSGTCETRQGFVIGKKNKVRPMLRTIEDRSAQQDFFFPAAIITRAKHNKKLR